MFSDMCYNFTCAFRAQKTQLTIYHLPSEIGLQETLQRVSSKASRHLHIQGQQRKHQIIDIALVSLFLTLNKLIPVGL